MEKKKIGRPKKSTKWHLMSLRFEPELVEKLDQLIEEMHEKERLKLSRVDLIRQAVWQFVDRELSETSEG
jgi:predicted transcriptional regulator